MKIRNVAHAGLRSLMEGDEPAGPRGTDATRLRRILTFLQDMGGESELRCVAGWKATPQLGPGWELRVAPIGALTFKIDPQGGGLPTSTMTKETAEPLAQSQWTASE